MYFIKVLFLIAIIIEQVSLLAALSCFNCAELVDSKCADPFDKTRQTGIKVNCPNSDNPKFTVATGCRKILQDIGGNVSVVRECAYSGDVVNGVKRVGNRGIRLYYYQCKDENCNMARSILPNSFWLRCGTIFAVALSFVAPVVLYI